MTKILALDHRTNELLGELNNRGDKVFYEPNHVRHFEGEHSFSFTMPTTIAEAKLFGRRSRFLIPMEDNGFGEFIVLRSSSIGKKKFVVGTAAYTEMDTEYILNPGTYTGTLEELANMVLPLTRYRLGMFEDIRIKTVKIEEHIGAYSFLLKLAKEFELETDFRVQTSGSRIIARYVHFLKRVGPDIKKELVYGKDLIDIEVKEFADRIATKLIGIGPTRSDGTYLTTEIVNEDAFQRWNVDGRHIIREYRPETSNTELTQAQLDQYTKTELDKRIASVVEYRVTGAVIEQALPHEKIRYGSSLRVKNPEYDPPLYAEARVIGVERSIIEKSQKVYTIGEVKTFTQEEIFRTFKQLQHLYGTKLIHKETAPDGQPKTIWIDTGTPLNVPHTFNFTTNEWEKFAPTNAAEIGGLMVGQQYNGVAITPEEGLVVDRTDGRVKTVVNATEGISIQARDSDLDPFQKVFFANEDGKLTLSGIDIIRPDGYKVIDNGMLQYDFALQGGNPSYTDEPEVEKVEKYYRTASTVPVNIDYYVFRHDARYVKLIVGLNTDTVGKTARFYAYSTGGGPTGGNVIGSFITTETDPSVNQVTVTLDFGTPTGNQIGFYARISTGAFDAMAYARIIAAYKEG